MEGYYYTVMVLQWLQVYNNQMLIMKMLKLKPAVTVDVLTCIIPKYIIVRTTNIYIRKRYKIICDIFCSKCV